MKKVMKVVRKGFTLIEILVVLLILSVLVAILAPGVIAQLGKEDPVRVAEDLTAVKTGINLFRLNMRPQFPGDLEDLAFAPSTGGDVDIKGTTFASAVEWKGPYVDASIVETADVSTATVPTSFGGSIVADFRRCTNAAGDVCGTEQTTGAAFVTVDITGISTTEFTELNNLIDGSGEANPTTNGKLRLSGSTARYLAVPFVH